MSSKRYWLALLSSVISPRSSSRVHAREIGGGDLQVVPVVRGNRAARLAEDQLLVEPDRMRAATPSASSVTWPARRGSRHRTARCARPFRRGVELDIRHPSRSRPKRAGSGAWTRIRLPHGQLTSICAPLRSNAKRVPSSSGRTRREGRRDELEVRDDQPDPAAQHLCRAGRQVELARADVDPGVVDADAQVRVAREAQAHHVEHDRELLVGHRDVDVAELDDVADVLRAAVVGRRAGRDGGHRRSPGRPFLHRGLAPRAPQAWQACLGNRA